MKGQVSSGHSKSSNRYKNRVVTKFKDEDIYEIDRLAMLWTLDRSDIIRIAVKKFLQDPTVDFILDAKEKKEFLRVEKKKHG